MGLKRIIGKAIREMAGAPARPAPEEPRRPRLLPVEPPPWRPAVHCGDSIVLTQTIFGHKIYVSGKDLDIAPHLIVNGYWEAWITAFLDRQLAPGDAFVDVGANVGYYALLAASKVGKEGKVLAVEPDPQTHQLLARNIYVNGLTDVVSVQQVALGDRDGEATLYARAEHKGASTLQAGWRSWREPWTVTPAPGATGGAAAVSAADPPGALATAPATAIPVRMARLDAFLDAFPFERALIKMDAEGAEPVIWEGMRQIVSRHARTLRIVMEFAPAMIADSGQDPARFLARMREAGFAIGRVDYEGRLAPADDGGLLGEALATITLAAQPSVWR